MSWPSATWDATDTQPLSEHWPLDATCKPRRLCLLSVTYKAFPISATLSSGNPKNIGFCGDRLVSHILSHNVPTSVHQYHEVACLLLSLFRNAKPACMLAIWSYKTNLIHTVLSREVTMFKYRQKYAYLWELKRTYSKEQNTTVKVMCRCIVGLL
jgi:hypothetical protein